jgi:TRAP-type C4-dicarboxylate transport system permease small subunit
MKSLARALDRAITIVWEWSLAAIVAGLLVVVVSQVIDRRFLDLWTGSPEEYVKIGLIWLTFIGFALAMRQGTEIRVDLADHFLPAKARALIYGAFDLLLLVLIAIVCWKSYLVWKVSLDQVILGTAFSVAVPTGGMLVGMAAMFVVVLFRMARRFRQALGHEVPRSQSHD